MGVGGVCVCVCVCVCVHMFTRVSKLYVLVCVGSGEGRTGGRGGEWGEDSWGFIAHMEKERERVGVMKLTHTT